MAPAIDKEDYLQTHLSSITEADEDICSICLMGLNEENEEAGNPVVTHCNHRFHEICISTWWGPDSEGREQRTCPMCKRELWALPKEPEWVPPPAIVNRIEEELVEDIDDQLGEIWDKDQVFENTGIRLDDPSDPERFVQASRLLYDRLVSVAGEHRRAFLNILSRSIIIRRLFIYYDSEMQTQEWLNLMQEFSYCRNEVEALGNAAENFPRGMTWPGLRVWDTLFCLSNIAVYEVDVDIPIGSRMVTSYSADGQLADAAGHARAIQQFVALQQIDANRQASFFQLDATPQTSPTRRIEYVHRVGLHKMAGYHDDIGIRMFRHKEDTPPILRIAVDHPGAIAGLYVSGDAKVVDIYTSDDHVISLRFGVPSFAHRCGTMGGKRITAE